MSEQEKSPIEIYASSYCQASDAGKSRARCEAEAVDAVAAHVRAPLDARIAALEADLRRAEEIMRPFYAFGGCVDDHPACDIVMGQSDPSAGDTVYLRTQDFRAIEKWIDARAVLKGGRQ